MTFVHQASVALTLEKETDKADLGHGTRAQVMFIVIIMLLMMMLMMMLMMIMLSTILPGVLLSHPARDWSCVCLSLAATC